MAERICVDCGGALPVQTGRGRPRKRCESCSTKSASAKKWREENAERVAAYNDARREEYNAGRRVGDLAQCSGCRRLYREKREDGRFLRVDNKCPECLRVRDRHEKHLRRVAKLESDLTAADLRLIVAAVTVCPICEVEMSELRGHLRKKHIDHIVPLNVGGKHVRANVRVICAACNLARPKDGSDVRELVAA